MKSPRHVHQSATPSGWSPTDTPAPKSIAIRKSEGDRGEGKGKGKVKGKDDWKLKSPRRKYRQQRDASNPAERDPQDASLQRLYGIHTVRQALSNPRRSVRRLLATENGAARLAEDGPMPIAPSIVKPDEIGRLLPADAVHQGVLLEADPLAPVTLDAIDRTGIVLALDQVTDPHNVGAILRSAAAFGVVALLITDRHSPEVTGVLAKAASGALEHVPFAIVRNLSDALDRLKARGFACVGLDSDAAQPIGALRIERPVVLVLGAEGKGLRQKTRDACTDLVRLEMPGAIRSLNVSNAAAIALYAVTAALSNSRA